MTIIDSANRDPEAIDPQEEENRRRRLQQIALRQPLVDDATIGFGPGQVPGGASMPARGALPPAPMMAMAGAVPPVPATGLPASSQARMFFDSDGQVRAGYGQIPPGPANERRDIVQTNSPADSTPAGMRMVPVTGLRGGAASVGVPAVDGAPTSLALTPEVPAVVDRLRGLALASAPSGVLRTTPEEQAQLARMGQQGPRSVYHQQEVEDRLREFEMGQRSMDAAAGRQIRVAQGTPHVVASSGGVTGWDPTANNGRGGVVSQVRPPAERSGAQRTTELSGARDQDLLAAHARMSPRPADKNSAAYMMAMQMAKTPEQKAAVEQQFSHPGDPAALAAIEAEMAKRPALAQFMKKGTNDGGAPAGGTSAASDAPAAAGERKYVKTW